MDGLVSIQRACARARARACLLLPREAGIKIDMTHDLTGPCLDVSDAL